MSNETRIQSWVALCPLEAGQNRSHVRRALQIWGEQQQRRNRPVANTTTSWIIGNVGFFGTRTKAKVPGQFRGALIYGALLYEPPIVSAMLQDMLQVLAKELGQPMAEAHHSLGVIQWFVDQNAVYG